ncbi:GerAB/ArcD/ProY family transporter [Propionispora hippei]|uniref:Spore germination protein KB n=1 Tax=Propionispora hippei DSM 15287 TaxID=1123003 RepID=A0A1M6LKG3_9FIRM|nr:GerAB/ArcD/ProY family transporter [Propionispora hippei]SHJ71696.1 spore germination protein KB [Propionispora hippei DSM 15287]
MKTKVRISNYQIFCLLVMHSLGSSTIFALGIRAKQDAWLVVLSGLVLGFGIIWLHTELQKHYPENNLTEINAAVLGKFLGSLVTLSFAGYFIWVSTLNFSEFAELIGITILPDTPILAIQCTFILLIIYLTYNGIEVLARMSEFLMPIVMLSLILMYGLTVISGNAHLLELQPILANGIKPVLAEVYPSFSTFPYGEDVVFLMFYCYSNNTKLIRKYAFSAIFLLGASLVASTILIIAVLGVPLAAATTIPLIEVVKMINIGNIITNIDAIAVIVIFVGGLFKAMLFFYGSVLALTTLLKLKRKRVIIAMAIFLVWINLTAIPNFVFHRFIGISFGNSYIHELYTIYLPLMLLIITWLKAFNSKLKTAGDGQKTRSCTTTEYCREGD